MYIHDIYLSSNVTSVMVLAFTIYESWNQEMQI